MAYSNYKSSLTIICGVALCLVTMLLCSCKPDHLTRPYGYLRLGPIKNFLAPVTIIAADRLVIKHDQNGFSVMSTLCTKDLSPLKEKRAADGGLSWVSEYTSSSYDSDGKVLSGPATINLPYYKLELSSLQIQGPKDTLYVHIGDEVSKDWRLRVAVP